MNTLISVCIPAYNSSEFIGETIKSILNQTYKNLELIIVDDQSKDNTIEIVESFKDERIKLYRNEKNLGMVGNWNRCLELAKGEYVKLICADDLLMPKALEKEAAAMDSNPSVNLVESDTALIDIYGKKTGAFRRYFRSGVVDGKKLAKTSLMLNNFFGAPCNNLIRKSILEKTGGFDSEFTYILDFDIWVRIACQGNVYIIHELLNSFRIRKDSNTGDLIKNNRKIYVDEHRRLVNKHARAGILKISSLECKISVLIRKFRNVLVDLYLKLFMK